MLNKKGYSIKELLILFAALAIVFAIAISRVSYAYDEIDNSEEMQAAALKHVEEASKIYIHDHKEEFEEETTYFYGSDLLEANYLTNAGSVDISNIKIKVTHNKEKDEYEVEIVK